MSIIYIIILFFLCLILYNSKYKSFLLWLAICAAVYFFLNKSAGVWGIFIYCFVAGADIETESSTTHTRGESNNGRQFREKIYEDGTRRTENLSETGYYYSNGGESWVGMLGDEHRSNGEVVRENAYIPGRRDIYNENGKYIGYEYEDSAGITHRVDAS